MSDQCVKNETTLISILGNTRGFAPEGKTLHSHLSFLYAAHNIDVRNTNTQLYTTKLL